MLKPGFNTWLQANYGWQVRSAILSEGLPSDQSILVSTTPSPPPSTLSASISKSSDDMDSWVLPVVIIAATSAVCALCAIFVCLKLRSKGGVSLFFPKNFRQSKARLNWLPSSPQEMSPASCFSSPRLASSPGSSGQVLPPLVLGGAEMPTPARSCSSTLQPTCSSGDIYLPPSYLPREDGKEPARMRTKLFQKRPAASGDYVAGERPGADETPKVTAFEEVPLPYQHETATSAQVSEQSPENSA
mmetsp:Transcript_30727/g.64702  ORF Transcript_30727/g.64702 Transcript_30727/m.64702 type:complete len:245 (-) Transcript_30727:575-1309(-)